MSDINMKVLSYGHAKNIKDDFIGENIPIKCFYNIKKCEKSDENIIDEINGDFTYKMFMTLMKKHSIVAIGPLLVDHEYISQISFISSEHDCSYSRECNGDTIFYPEIAYQMDYNYQIISRNVDTYPPSEYYGGVFVFKGILNETLCKYISEYLNKDIKEVTGKIGGSVKDKIRSTLVYYVEQSSIKDASTLIKNLHYYLDSTRIPTQPPNKEQSKIIQMIIKEQEEHFDLINNVYDLTLIILKNKIEKALTTEDTQEDYNIYKFLVRDFYFSYGTIEGSVRFFAENSDDSIEMYYDIKDEKLNIQFFFQHSEEKHHRLYKNIIYEQFFDIGTEETIIYLKLYDIEPMAKYFNIDKFHVFLTRFFNLILESSSTKVCFGNKNIKFFGNRRERKNERDDDMIAKKQSCQNDDSFSKVSED